MFLTKNNSYEYLVGSIEALFATRFIFLIVGFAMASWAPLVPFVKNNLVIDEKELEVVDLCVKKKHSNMV